MSIKSNSLGVLRAASVFAIAVAILVSSMVAAITMMQPTAKGEPTQPQWTVLWKSLTGTLDWGGDIGTSYFCSTFDYNWEQNWVFYDNTATYRYDYVGFYAYMRITKSRDGPVSFTVSGDDYYWLYIDRGTPDQIEMKKWSSGYGSTQITLNNMKQGIHTLELYYKEYTWTARLSFSCDSDLVT